MYSSECYANRLQQGFFFSNHWQERKENDLHHQHNFTHHIVSRQVVVYEITANKMLIIPMAANTVEDKSLTLSMMFEKSFPA